ncbi:hypothetical protein D3C78_1139970 [compost metagenome]
MNQEFVLVILFVGNSIAAKGDIANSKVEEAVWQCRFLKATYGNGCIGIKLLS